METHFTAFDWAIVAVYFVGVLSLGLLFFKRSQSSAEQFTAGGRSLSGWLCGLSIFATYLSSISFLALPGKSFADNWNPFVFSLALPIAAWISVAFFVPYYRRTGEISAYAMLERRFGLWARWFASLFFLLFQLARMGLVLYLMALPLAVIFAWDIRLLILAAGLAVTLYALVGGIVAVIWADAIQAVVLSVGAVLALVLLLAAMPQGPGQVWTIAMAQQPSKFSLGSFDLSEWLSSTFWVILIYGLFENLKNFGIDQNYIQRYLAAADRRQAARSVWLGALLYIPVSALFFMIGTSLFAFYQVHPEEMQEVRVMVAGQQIGNADRTADELAQPLADLTPAQVGDRVFPHFIAKHLPSGLTGLLVAAVFAAAMSTVSTSLNSSATILMNDFYVRGLRPQATDRQRLQVLRATTLVMGLLGAGLALLLVQVTASALDVWWGMSSVLGAGILGLFLLGMLSRRAQSADAMAGLAAGGLLVAWMLLSQSALWPPDWADYASPFNAVLSIVLGSLTILLVGSTRGWLRQWFGSRSAKSGQNQGL